MKKVMFLVALVLGMGVMSCKKENVAPTNSVNKCRCGNVNSILQTNIGGTYIPDSLEVTIVNPCGVVEYRFHKDVMIGVNLWDDMCVPSEYAVNLR